MEIFEIIKDKRFIVFVNKIDKEVKVLYEDIKRIFGKEGIFIFVEYDKNLEFVEKVIVNEVLDKDIEVFDSVFIINFCYKEFFLKVKEFLFLVKENFDCVFFDIFLIDIKNVFESFY